MLFVVDRDLCIACEECVAICPAGAVQILEGKAQIDHSSCLSCGACLSECPQEAIKMRGMRNGATL